MQVMRASPDVQDDQRPEVNDGQATGIHRAFCLLGHEEVHDPEEAGSQKEPHSISGRTNWTIASVAPK